MQFVQAQLLYLRYSVSPYYTQSLWKYVCITFYISLHVWDVEVEWLGVVIIKSLIKDRAFIIASIVL